MIVKNEPTTLWTTDQCSRCTKEYYCKVKIGETCPGAVREFPDDDGHYRDGENFDV